MSDKLNLKFLEWCQFAGFTKAKDTYWKDRSGLIVAGTDEIMYKLYSFITGN